MTLSPQPTTPIESHDVHSRRLIRHARDELENGDRLQASEKAWGAVAHRLKVIADDRGWRYDRHSDVYDIARRLERELGPRMRPLFVVASGLHRNYYVDAVPLYELRRQLGEVEELLAMLDQADL